MRRGIKEITGWNDTLRETTLNQANKKKKLEHKLSKVYNDTKLFYSRARAEIDKSQ